MQILPTHRVSSRKWLEPLGGRVTPSVGDPTGQFLGHVTDCLSSFLPFQSWEATETRRQWIKSIQPLWEYRGLQREEVKTIGLSAGLHGLAS